MRRLMLGLLLLCTGCKIDSRDQKKNEGRRAASLGLPANANPYIGRTADWAEWWLEGYMDEKEKR